MRIIHPISFKFHGLCAIVCGEQLRVLLHRYMLRIPFSRKRTTSEISIGSHDSSCVENQAAALTLGRITEEEEMQVPWSSSIGFPHLDNERAFELAIKHSETISRLGKYDGKFTSSIFGASGYAGS